MQDRHFQDLLASLSFPTLIYSYPNTCNANPHWLQLPHHSTVCPHSPTSFSYAPTVNQADQSWTSQARIAHLWEMEICSRRQFGRQQDLFEWHQPVYMSGHLCVSVPWVDYSRYSHNAWLEAGTNTGFMHAFSFRIIHTNLYIIWQDMHYWMCWFPSKNGR